MLRRPIARLPPRLLPSLEASGQRGHFNLTQLGEALAGYGRIFKTLHVLSFVDDEPYRRQIKGMRNPNECRHDLARHVVHGRRGELHRAYHEGMEDQLGALGLVLNCITLWNTLYLDIALAGRRAQGYSVLDADVPRLSPYVRQHIRVDGHYTFTRPDLGGRTTGHYATPTPAKTNSRDAP